MKKLVYLQRRTLKRRRAVLLIFVTLFVVSFFLYVYLIAFPVVTEATRATVFTLSTSAVSDAIYDVLEEETISYNDLVTTTFDSDGKIELISVNTVMVNSLVRRIYQVAQQYLDEMGSSGINIALGTFTGLPFLVGMGPSVNVKLVSIGAMTSSFTSSFTGAGINQTSHSIYIIMHASVSLVLPAYSATVDSVTEFLLAESVIVGDVPSVYLGSSSSVTLSPSE